ncbi:hypothetical protein L3Y34_012798 [Caenorhabditis briggsae]|uniref:Uncharacterized protein n=1 Tax=Caenorhabditis briggsae TaxID=6238 RepID=A0AAE8ZZK7_CAEBR|nr:hypothetical protein L3Y34_012798 [Caenorhabditis briggsae]
MHLFSQASSLLTESGSYAYDVSSMLVQVRRGCLFYRFGLPAATLQEIHSIVAAFSFNFLLMSVAAQICKELSDSATHVIGMILFDLMKK